MTAASARSHLRRSALALAITALASVGPCLADAQPPPSPARRVVRLSAAGDLVLNLHSLRTLLDDEGAGYARLLAGWASVLRPDEIVYVNVEQPLVNDLVALDPGWPRQDTSRPRRSPVLGATPALADALAAAGVDAAGLANNHAYDQGRRGLARTIEELARVRVATFGAGAGLDAAYAPLVVERDGVRVAFVGFTEFFNQPPQGGGDHVAARLADEALVAAAITAARARADVVVVAVHWSRDFEMRAGHAVRRLARRFVEAGADVILGTGPHVLHEVERVPSPRGEAVVAYSLGNLASGMGRAYRLGHPPRAYIHPANVVPDARDGVVLRLALSVEGPRVGVDAIEAVPLWMENNWLESQRDGVPHRVAVTPLADAAPEVRAERLPIVTRALGPQVTLRER